ncbi:hypothetical protein F5B22DRAFT_643206 [Xylaria bambusicola]|uniref:uncharacterized protein n=1 Tax=Xylaria bambusicola TaxID=326684 RepID=UPI0020076D8C|nr:uncharacterized protein F5B22DRAFT_643206 [Xylaria bambusicola]KAI0522183.1 hypothetical protein F5B22DRAFT_643206 [Xylaria bambusicola]
MLRHIRPCEGIFALLSLVSSHLVAATNLTTADIHANDPPPPLVDGCISNSFLAPVWAVDAFQYEENDNGDSTANFILSSKVITNKLKCFGRAEGRRQSVQGECTNENERHKPSSQFLFVPSSRSLSIEPSWSCNGNDVREPTNFVGNGTTKLDIDCEWIECTLVNSTRILVKLHEPLEISPYIPPPPPGHSAPGCSSRSKSPSWSISEFTWYRGVTQYTTPNPIGFPPVTQYLGYEAGGMKVKNQAIQQTFVCGWQTWDEGTSVEPRENWWCNNYSEEEVKTARHTYEAEITFRHISSENKLLVNQTWYCDDEGRGSPEKFHATGSINVTGSSGGLFPGQPPTTVSNYTIEGKLESHYEMEPYALELPNAQAARCTVTSLDAQRFFLVDPTSRYPTYWTYENRSYGVSGEFSLYLRFPFEDDDQVLCRVKGPELHPTKFDPERWWHCEMLSYGGDPMNVKALDFNYNRNTTILSINATWTCDDANREKPIYIHAFASGSIGDPVCHYDDYWTWQHCDFPALNITSPPFSLPFTNFTFDVSG